MAGDRLAIGMSAQRRKEEEELRRNLASRRLLSAIGLGGLEEAEADEVALRVVRRVRRGTERGAEEPAPSPQEVRERRASDSFRRDP